MRPDFTETKVPIDREKIKKEKEKNQLIFWLQISSIVAEIISFELKTEIE